MTAQIGRVWYTVLAVGIVVAAIGLRFYPFSSSYFPLNDGALFLAFVDHIHAGLYFAETCVDYNGDCIPFAYPPLSFFLASLLSFIGLPSISIGVIYPLGISILTIIPIFLLAREAVENRVVQLLAFATMLLQIRSIEYVLMGGGISRATGALFFLMALVAACKLAKSGSWSSVVFSGLAIGAATLSHLEWGINAALGSTILALFCAQFPFRKNATFVLVMGAISAAVVAPWIGWVLATNGLDPFTSASGTAGWTTSRIVGLLDLEFFPRMLGLVSAIGVGALAIKGNYAWTVMLVAFYLATPRHFGSVAVFPAAILAAYGIFTIADQSLKQVGKLIHLQRTAISAVGVVLVIVLALGSVQLNAINSRQSFRQVSPDVLLAADWAHEEFGADAKSANLSSMQWFISREAEWWPYLTGHTNLNTVQGSEWLGREVFRKRVVLANRLIWKGDCSEWLSQLGNISDVDYVIANEAAHCFEGHPEFTREFTTDAVSLFAIIR